MRSPDFTCRHYFLWGYLKDIVNEDSIEIQIQLKRKIKEASDSIKNNSEGYTLHPRTWRKSRKWIVDFRYLLKIIENFTWIPKKNYRKIRFYWRKNEYEVDLLMMHSKLMIKTKLSEQGIISAVFSFLWRLVLYLFSDQLQSFPQVEIITRNWKKMYVS